MTSPATSVGRTATWTPEAVINAIQEWVATYGDVPRAADLNPSSARWGAQLWRIERYEKGRADGSRWPSLNAVKAHFDGSLTKAIIAAGYEPAKPGPKNRKDVSMVPRESMTPSEMRVAMEAAEAQVKALTEKVDVRDRQLVRARERAERAAYEARLAEGRAANARGRTVTETRVKTKTKTIRVADLAAVRRAEKKAEREVRTAQNATLRAQAKLTDAEEALGVEKAKVKEARAAATKAVSKRERAEATINTLREERRDLRERTREAELAARVAERERDGAVARAETRPVVVKDAPAQDVIDAAKAEAKAADRRAHEAEVRAARAERDYAEIAAATTGQDRRLTRAEMDELRSKGPGGPALLADALKKLARARKLGNNRTALMAALTEVASAAVSWNERL